MCASCNGEGIEPEVLRRIKITAGSILLYEGTDKEEAQRILKGALEAFADRIEYTIDDVQVFLAPAVPWQQLPKYRLR